MRGVDARGPRDLSHARRPLGVFVPPHTARRSREVPLQPRGWELGLCMKQAYLCNSQPGSVRVRISPSFRVS